MTKKTPRLVLLDSHAIIHRAYHALPDFMSSKGEPTGALYGIVAMLASIIKDLDPTYIIACYDLPEKTFRHHAFEGYKANRKSADDALVAQIIRSREIFEAFGVPIYEAPGFEADDVLGTLVEQFKSRTDIDIVIATGDMDTLQLVEGDHIKVYTLKKGIQDTILYNEQAVLDRYGFLPALVPDYKGLRGDPSDNIPGIPGIGEKTATQIIQAFGTVEALYEALQKDEGLLKQAGLKERIIGLIRDHEEEAHFSKTLATIRRDAPIEGVIPENSFRESVNLQQVMDLLERFEFRTLVPRIRNLLGGGAEAPKAPQPEAANDPDLVLRAGIGLWLLDSDKTNPSVDEILRATNTFSLSEAYDVIYASLTKEKLLPVFEEIELPVVPIVRNMEERGVLIDKDRLLQIADLCRSDLAEREIKIHDYAGRSFNINSPKQLSEILFEELKLAHKGKRGATGSFSTRADILEELIDVHPIVPLIIEYRERAKLISTYLDVIPTLVASDGRLHAKFIQHGTTTGRFSSSDPNLQNIPIRTELGKTIRGAFVAAPGHVFIAADYSQIELRVAAVLSRDPKLIEIFRSGKDVHASVAASVFKVPETDVTKEMRRRAKIINFGILYGMGVRALKQALGSTQAEADQFMEEYLATYTGLRSYLESAKDDARQKGYTETLFGRRRYFPGLSSKLPFLRAQAERMATNAPIQGTNADFLKLAMRFIDEDIRAHKLQDKAHLILQIHDELIYEVEESVSQEVQDIIRKRMTHVSEDSFLHKELSVPLIVDIETGKRWSDV